MLDYIIKELQWKAESLQKTGLVTVHDSGVVKSDTAIPEELRRALKEAVSPFECVPDDEKDYHPGSDGKVVDLVHPSLFPVIYGRTRILFDKVISIDDCLGSIGQGDILQVPPENETAIVGYPQNLYGWRRMESEGLRPFSRKFQWLPCDVKFIDHDGECRILSYINNVHPTEHCALYQVIEKIISRTIPLWNRTLTNARGEGRQHERLIYDKVEYLPTSTPRPVEGDYSSRAEYLGRVKAWEESGRIKLPEPEEFVPPEISHEDEIDLQRDFQERGLQIIVKLANIELTPEKPEYGGGTWHIEGQLVRVPCFHCQVKG
jgi:hypothetical protein